MTASFICGLIAYQVAKPKYCQFLRPFLRERASLHFLTPRFCCSSPAPRVRCHLHRCERERQGLSEEVIDANYELDFGHAVASPCDAVCFRCRFSHTSTSTGTCTWCRTLGAKTPRRVHPQVGCNGTSPLHSPSRLGRALTGSAHLARPQEAQIGTSSSRSTFGAAATCEQLPVAPASQADDPSVQTRYDSSSLSLSVAPSHPLSHASHRPLFTGTSRPSATRPASPTSFRAGLR